MIDAFCLYLHFIQTQMRKNLKLALMAGAAVLAASCAKVESEATYASAKLYVDAWMHVNYPTVEVNEDGIYIIEDTPGDGIAVDTLDYLYVDYEIKTLDGKYSKVSSAERCQQLGTYDMNSFYGPHLWCCAEGSQYAGVRAMVKDMKIGGSRTALVPRWMISTKVLDTPEDYLNDSKGGSEDYIYTITIKDGTNDICKWQEDSIDRYIDRVYGKDKVVFDTTGFRYIRLTEPKDTNSFPTDTTIYINYTGRLLNGQVFDTTIEKLAKDTYLYNSSRSYGPSSVTWGESYSDIKLGSSTVITGFSYTLWQMRKYEKGVGIFYSEYGYSSSGSGESIPEYSPLIFEIELVDEP